MSNSENNGGNTDYYKIQPEWTTLNDVIEARDMSFAQGNILKSAFTLNTSRHKGTHTERELNKIIYYAERLLRQLK